MLNSHMRCYVTQWSATRLCGTAPPPPGKTSFSSPVKINFQPFLLILGVHIRAFKRERHLFSWKSCNKLNKTNMLSANISRELKNSGISFPSIYRIRPSRDPYCSFKSQHLCQNPLLGLLCCFRWCILTLNLTLYMYKMIDIGKPWIIKQETERMILLLFVNS